MECWGAGVIHTDLTRIRRRPPERRYSDWIDVNGRRRDYFYTDHNMLAIVAGIANASQVQCLTLDG